MTSLNRILARWLDVADGPPVDCAGCARPRKCCDFQPFVPNFLAGAILTEGGRLDGEDGRFVRQPLGLIPSRGFRSARAVSTCAFYDRGRCGIWEWRPGECSTHNCVKEDPAASARTFAFESTLAQMALVELGFAHEFVRGQIDILNDPGEELVHADDVEHHYRRAWAWARNLSRADIAAWLEDV